MSFAIRYIVRRFFRILRWRLVRFAVYAALVWMIAMVLLERI